MSYCKRTVVFPGKDHGEQEVYFTTRRFSGKINQRGRNKGTTPADVEKINELNALDKLRWLINSNFGPGDLHLVLTYQKDKRPELPVSKALVQQFLAKLRRKCKADGKELKYIWATEVGERGAVHHHFVLPFMDLRELQETWPHGKVRLQALLDRTGEYSGLADYLIKQTRKTFRRDDAPHKRRYNGSKNLTQPVITYQQVNAERWNPNPKNTRDYDVIPGTVVNGIHGRTATPYRFFRFRLKTAPDIRRE